MRLRRLGGLPLAPFRTLEAGSAARAASPDSARGCSDRAWERPAAPARCRWSPPGSLADEAERPRDGEVACFDAPESLVGLDDLDPHYSVALRRARLDGLRVFEKFRLG